MPLTVRWRWGGRGGWSVIGVILMTWALLLAGCGQEQASSGPEALSSREEICLDGESLDASYLKISSTTEGQTAVSVTNGGQLTLSDSTIRKTGPEESGSPVADTVGGAEDAPPMDLEGDRDAVSPPLLTGDLPGNGAPDGMASEGAGGAQGIPAPDVNHAGVYAGNGGAISLFNVGIETAMPEGTGIYASGDGSSVALVNGTITTDGSTAHGVLVAHNGAVSVKNVAIITRGEHSSALATNRGKGTVTAVGGTYTAFGKYSAGIYSAGDVSVTDVVCKSLSDRAVVVEGGSRINLKDSVLWSRRNGAVMIYHSFSGDVPMGAAEFEMTGGSISAEDGPIFYVTNTTGEIFLKHVGVFGVSGVFLSAMKGPWGVNHSWAKPTQGGNVTVVAEEQYLVGDVIADEFSTVDVILKSRSTLDGSINPGNTGKAVRLSLDASCSWHVTGDSHLTELRLEEGAGTANIVGNGHTVYYRESGAEFLRGRSFDLPRGGKLMPEQPLPSHSRSGL